MARVGCEEHSRDEVASSSRIALIANRNYRGRVVAPGREACAEDEDVILKRGLTRALGRAFGEFSRSAYRRCASSYRAFHHNADARRSSLSSRSAAIWRCSAAIRRGEMDSSSVATCESRWGRSGIGLLSITFLVAARTRCMHPERHTPTPVAERIAKRLQEGSGRFHTQCARRARHKDRNRDIRTEINIVNFEFVLAT
jgi:hypothetical protein